LAAVLTKKDERNVVKYAVQWDSTVDIKEKLAIYSKIPGSEYEIMEYCPDEVQFYSPILEIGPGTLPHVPHEVHFDFSAFLYCGIVDTLSCNIRFIAGQDIDALYSKGMLSKYVS
jgi:hypothetical protein